MDMDKQKREVLLSDQDMEDVRKLRERFNSEVSTHEIVSMALRVAVEATKPIPTEDNQSVLASLEESREVCEEFEKFLAGQSRSPDQRKGPS